MRTLSAVLLLVALAAALPASAAVHHDTLAVPDVGTITYGISVPDDYDPKFPVALVLVLHPGGERSAYYGALYLRQMFEPALRGLDAIFIAPDCPTNAWSDPAADRAVMALIEQTQKAYAIDRRRVLVTGFSMGGRGTWFMSSRHADLFTAAIPMAASTGNEPLEPLATMPTYVIHGRNDEIMPFANAERTAAALAKMGKDVHFEGLNGLTHFQMNGYIPALSKAGRWVAERWARTR